MAESGDTALSRHIDDIEQAYEMFLSYAAKGTSGAGDSGPGSDIRMMITRALDALRALEVHARAQAQGDGPLNAWIDVTVADAAKAETALALVNSCDRVSSQLIDNVNASIHLRALLTDLFVLDEALNAKLP